MNKKSQFFTNYDYTENSSGPGAGLYMNMDKYKSVKDFLKKRRKRRKRVLDYLTKKAQEQFMIDNTLSGLPSNDSTYTNSIPIGGLYDYYTPLQPNKEDSNKGLSGDYLLNGQKDYSQDYPSGDKFLNQYINPEGSHVYGLDREYDIEESENTYEPGDPKYNISDLKQETFRDVKPYP